jgi:hypothetical protein
MDSSPAKVDTAEHPDTRLHRDAAPLFTEMRRITFDEAFFAKKTHEATFPGVAFEGVPRTVVAPDEPEGLVKEHPLPLKVPGFGSETPFETPTPIAATTLHGPPAAMVPSAIATGTA